MVFNYWTTYIDTWCFPQEVWLKNRKLKNNADIIKQVNKLYFQNGFKITLIHADRKFKPLQA